MSPRIPSYEILVKFTSGKLLFPVSHVYRSILAACASLRLFGSIYRVFFWVCYFLRYFSVEILMCFAKVDFPMPGRPTGTKNSLLTPCISVGEMRSAMNLKSDCSIYSSLHPKGTETMC